MFLSRGATVSAHSAHFRVTDSTDKTAADRMDTGFKPLPDAGIIRNIRTIPAKKSKPVFAFSNLGEYRDRAAALHADSFLNARIFRAQERICRQFVGDA